MILVASVMHTGTLFTMNKLLSDKHEIAQVHFTSKHYGRMTKKLEDAEHVIIPLRHPARCLEAFKRRNKGYDDFVEQWDNMVARVSNMNPCYVHIDDIERREQDVEKISNLVNPVIDWQPSVRAGMKTFTYKLELSDEMIKAIPKQYIDFYESDKQ